MASSDDSFSFLPKIMNGGIAGIVGVTCVFPIDLVKTRLQNQKEGARIYSGMWDCAKKTFRSEGGLLAMYKGSGVNLLLITPEKAIKLVGNDFFRYALKKEGKPLSPIREMTAGGGAGMCQIIVTTPMELLKIRLQMAKAAVVASETVTTTASTPKKVSATRLAMEMYREKGILGLYRGMGATFMRDVTFSAIYFPLFANLNALGPRRSGGTGSESVFYWAFLSGCTAGCVASFSVNPIDVVKTRLQFGTEHNKIFPCFRSTFQHEGLLAFFKGAGCRIMVIAPLFGIAQTVYYLGVAEFLLGVQKI